MSVMSRVMLDKALLKFKNIIRKRKKYHLAIIDNKLMENGNIQGVLEVQQMPGPEGCPRQPI